MFHGREDDRQAHVDDLPDEPDEQARRARSRAGCRGATRQSASATPSVVKMRRTSRARAPMQRRMPISRVRSSTFVVIAFASPTMLIATITKPSTAIVVVSERLAAISSRSATYVISLVDLVAERRQAVLEQAGGAVDERLARATPS